MRHPKVWTLSAGAFRLWMAGLSYAQEQLTDGVIHRGQLRALPLRSFSRKDIDDLCNAGLWDVTETGFQIHDYLDWNDSRGTILQKRGAAKDRLLKHRQVGSLKRVAHQSSETVLVNASETQRETALPSSGVGISSGSGSFRERGAGRGTLATAEQAALDSRAATFLQRYETQYPKWRNGATYYCTRRSDDFRTACELVRAWPDDDWLDKMAQLFLRTDHKFAAEGSRTINQFAAIASWCDSTLREKGLRPKGEASA